MGSGSFADTWVVAAVAFLGAFGKVRVNETVVPFPGLDSSQILPPSTFSIMALQILSPRPLPPYERAVELSAWEKGWKSFVNCSLLIPMPVSDPEHVILILHLVS